jgi:hypothetical protein
MGKDTWMNTAITFFDCKKFDRQSFFADYFLGDEASNRSGWNLIGDDFYGFTKQYS